MARGGRWFGSLFSGKKEKDKEEEGNKKNGRKQQQQQQQQQQQSRSPVPSPGGKEKKRWSFRRPVDATRMKELNSTGADDDQKRHALAVAAATKAAAEAAAAAAQAAAVVIRLTASAKCRLSIAEEVAAATKIQAGFRSYLARKALRALKGIVKLQALIRGQLVRKLVSLHAMDRAHQRALIAKEAQMMMIKMISHRKFSHRGSPSPLDPRCGRTYELDRNLLENIKIVQMDLSGSTWSSRDERKSTKSSPFRYDIRKQQQKQQQQLSSPTSALTDKSEESSFRTSESSPYPYSNSIKENMYLISNNYDLYPNYMAKTASSVAKARSQSTPRQRPASPRRRTSIGSANEAAYQFPWKENFYKSLV